MKPAQQDLKTIHKELERLGEAVQKLNRQLKQRYRVTASTPPEERKRNSTDPPARY